MRHYESGIPWPPVGYSSGMPRLIAVLLLFVASAAAQGSAAPAQTGTTALPPAQPEAQRLAARFGPAFKPAAGFPVFTADFDGDGTEDAVVVATADNPLADQLEFHYKVIDPFYAYFGFGDPKTTTQFIPLEANARLLLIVHNWRGAGLKFVVVNLPFERLSLGRLGLKKKSVATIQAEELTGTRSLLYWDGKKWRWKDVGMP